MAEQKIEMETVVPIGRRVLILRDEPKGKTKNGVLLPDSLKIPTLRGTILAIGKQVASDDDFSELTQYCKVLYLPRGAVPVEFEEGKQVVIDVDDVVAIIARPDKAKRATAQTGGPRGH